MNFYNFNNTCLYIQYQYDNLLNLDKLYKLLYSLYNIYKMYSIKLNIE